MAKFTIIHHNDLDGIAAAAIVYNYLADKFSNYSRMGCMYQFDVAFVEYKYDDASNVAANEALKTAADENHDGVYIVDISISDTNIDQLQNIYKIDPDKIVWCDHHVSSINWLKSVAGTDRELKYRGTVNTRRCGAALIYQFLYNCTFRSVPAFVKLVDDYDRYILSRPESEWFNAAFYGSEDLRDPTDDNWKIICSLFNKNNPSALGLFIKRGRVIMDYQEHENAIARKTKMYPMHIDFCTDDSKFERYNCMGMNHSGSPDVFGDVRNDERVDVCVTWYVTRDNNIKYSFRSSHNWVRCDIIAKYLGGGGHVLAAGAVENGRTRASGENIILHISKDDMKAIRRALKKRPKFTDDAEVEALESSDNI